MRSSSLPAVQAQPTSTSEMRRDCPEHRTSSEVGATSVALRLPSSDDAAIQMTVDDYIEVAERECLDGPCQCVRDCDYAGGCLAFRDPISYCTIDK